MLEDAEDDRDVECEFLDHGYFVGQVWEAFFHHPPPIFISRLKGSVSQNGTKWPLNGDDIVSSRSWTLRWTHTSVPELQRYKHHLCGTGFCFLFFYNDNFFQLRISLFQWIKAPMPDILVLYIGSNIVWEQEHPCSNTLQCPSLHLEK